jgi:hypothetical protein
MIRTTNGNGAYTDWSGTVSALCHPKTPGPLEIAQAYPIATGVDISWSQEDGITEWAVLVYDIDTIGVIISTIGIEAGRTSAHVDSLEPGIHHVFAVQGWNEYGGGYPGLGPSVTVGEGTPPIPTNLQITSIDGTTIQLDRCGSHEAAGYRFWVRNINNATGVLSAAGSTSSASSGWSYLFPGVGTLSSASVRSTETWTPLAFVPRKDHK